MRHAQEKRKRWRGGGAESVVYRIGYPACNPPADVLPWVEAAPREWPRMPKATHGIHTAFLDPATIYGLVFIRLFPPAAADRNASKVAAFFGYSRAPPNSLTLTRSLYAQNQESSISSITVHIASVAAHSLQKRVVHRHRRPRGHTVAPGHHSLPTSGCHDVIRGYEAGGIEVQLG